MDPVLAEEFEVLESIYPTEISKHSDRDLHIQVEPDDIDEGTATIKLDLSVQYPDAYPDAIPEFTFTPLEGELDDKEQRDLLASLRSVGEDNIGMAMTFSLISHLREQLSNLVRSRAEEKLRKERELERIALEEEEARTRGTPVTVESFKAWKLKFDQEEAKRKAKEDEERVKGLTPKERDEFKKLGSRLSGRQLFERNTNLEDESLLDEDAVSVDVSQYERVREQEEEEEEGVTFSDSD